MFVLSWWKMSEFAEQGYIQDSGLGGGGGGGGQIELPKVIGGGGGAMQCRRV